MYFSACLIFLLTIGSNIVSSQSNYFAYTYNNDLHTNEHCCLVRTNKHICKAIPLTSRLLQLTEQCQNFETRKKSSSYFDRISRRLDIVKTHSTGIKLLIELEKPLEKKITDNDLLCLSPKTNQINLDRCYLEIIDKNQGQLQSVNHSDATDADRRKEVKLDRPVIIRRAQGLSIVRNYTVDRTSDRVNGKCWSWYRHQTMKFCQDHRKFPEKCLELEQKYKPCLEQLITADQTTSTYELHSFHKGTKLFCENSKQIFKLLGSYRRSDICFKIHDQLTIEHKFSDLVQLSEPDHNEDVLQFLAANDELKKDFQRDCNDRETLENIVIKPIISETPSTTQSTVTPESTDPVNSGDKVPVEL